MSLCFRFLSLISSPCLTFHHYIGYSSHYIHTCIVHTEERKERQTDTERPGMPPWFFYVPGVQLRYRGPTFYVPIRWMKLGKSCRCLRTHHTQRSGWYSNPVPRVLKSAPLPLSYRGSFAKQTCMRYWSAPCRFSGIFFANNSNWYY